MDEIDLVAKVLISRDAGGQDETTCVQSRTYRVSLRRSVIVKAWATRHFNIALRTASPDEVVKVEITGSSADGSHHLATGSMFGWGGQVRGRQRAFDK